MVPFMHAHLIPFFDLAAHAVGPSGHFAAAGARMCDLDRVDKPRLVNPKAPHTARSSSALGIT